ncbi:MAG: pyruvate ferredoxin oxidoreductase [Pseudomonadota bacterium]
MINTSMISGNHCAALAAVLAGGANASGRGFCSGVYPITPSTECMEFLCQRDIPKGHVVLVESEHSAMGVCIGASASGARAFTTTGGNGLIYMAENVAVAALLRLPIVMAVGNRAVGPPWNIWTDHGDSLMLRDTGWMQFYCGNNQEVFDMILTAFRVAEDHRVLLPAMVCQEGFILTHTMMPTVIADQETVNRFLPALNLPHRLAESPRTLGGFDTPRMTEVHRRQHHEAMDRVWEVYGEAQDEFQAIFGRRPPDPVVSYRTEDADTLLVSMGTIVETIDRVVDRARSRGSRIGSVRVTMFRPFPEKQLKEAFRTASRIAVIDRNVSLGIGGVLWSESRGLAGPGTIVRNYIAGIGGGDVRPHHVEEMVADLCNRESAGDPLFIGVGE